MGRILPRPSQERFTGQKAFRSRLQGFYSVMKSQDGKLRFGFLTGVTKLGKLSIFSGLNNLNDISRHLRNRPPRLL